MFGLMAASLQPLAENTVIDLAKSVKHLFYTKHFHDLLDLSS